MFDINDGSTKPFTLINCILNGVNAGQMKCHPKFVNCNTTFNTSGLIVDGAGIQSYASMFNQGSDFALTLTNTPANNSASAVVLIEGNDFQLSAGGKSLRIESTADAAAAFSIVGNTSNLPADFFETGAGELDQTDPRVNAHSNLGVRDSSALVEVTLNDNIPVSQTIAVTMVPQLVKGLTMLSVGMTQRFTVVNSNPGMADNITTITYTGLETITVNLTFFSLVNGGATDEVGIGLFLNGNAVTATFFTLAQAPERLDTRSFLIELDSTDTIEMGVLNDTDISPVMLQNPTIHIFKIN